MNLRSLGLGAGSCASWSCSILGALAMKLPARAEAPDLSLVASALLDPASVMVLIKASQCIITMPIRTGLLALASCYDLNPWTLSWVVGIQGLGFSFQAG